MATAALTDHDLRERLARTVAVDGIALIPTDAGRAVVCDPQAKEAVRRAYAVLRRPVTLSGPVLLGDPELARAALPELDDATHAALRALAGRPVAALVPNPGERFALACGERPGLLLVRLPGAPLAGSPWPLLALEAEPPPPLAHDGADLVLDGPRTPLATIVDLRTFARDGEHRVLRDGAMPAAEVAARLPAV